LTSFASASVCKVVVVHLRPPSIDKGITACLWALGLALFVWVGLLAIGISQGAALIVGLLAFGAIFLLVRIYGEGTPKT
jgi:hypothetical protein